MESIENLLFEKALNKILGMSNKVTRYAQDKIAERRRLALRDPEFDTWIREYYAAKSDSRLLTFSDKQNGRSRCFPFLTRPEWLPTTAPTIDLDIRFDKKRRSDQPIDKQFIWQQQSLGRRLVDNDCYALFNVGQTGCAIELTFGLCTYFQYVSICSRIASETISQYRKGPKANTPFRDQFASSLPAILESSDGARATGVVVAVAFRNSEDSAWRVMLQERSNNVVAGEGMLMPMPGFSFQPTVKTYEKRECDLQHNFLRELCEEYYGQTELQDYSGRIDPKWFYQYDPVDVLVRNTSLLEFDVVGIGVDATNGEPTIACAATIHYDNFLKDGKVENNWESKHTELVRLDDESVSNLIFRKNITGLGALALMGLLRSKSAESFDRFAVSVS